MLEPAGGAGQTLATESKAIEWSLLTYRVIHSQEDQQGDGGHSSVDPLL